MIKTCVLTAKDAEATFVAVAQEDGGTIEKCYATTVDVANANNSESTKNVQLSTEYYKADTNPGDVLSTSSEQVGLANAKTEKETIVTEAIDEEVKESAPTDTTYVARVGTTGCSTLDEAFGAAKNGGTITLLDNITESISNNINFHAKGDVVLDLNGKTWTVKSQYGWPEGIRLYEGNLTIKNGTILGHKLFAVEGGTLTIESGNYYNADFIDDNDQSIGGTDTCGVDGNLVIKGGTFGNICLNAGCQSVKISGGTFNGTISCAYGDVNFTGTINISGGTFNNGVDGSIGTLNISGGTFNNQVSCKKTGVTNITGGTFNGYVGNDATVNISGGTFDATKLLINQSTFNITGGTFRCEATYLCTLSTSKANSLNTSKYTVQDADSSYTYYKLSDFDGDYDGYASYDAPYYERATSSDKYLLAYVYGGIVCFDYSKYCGEGTKTYVDAHCTKTTLTDLSGIRDVYQVANIGSYVTPASGHTLKDNGNGSWTVE